METEGKQKKKYRHPDHATLSPASLSKVAGWIEQMSLQMKDKPLSKSNVVEFLVESHGDLLTSSECKKLKDKFFDEVKFHEWAVREYKQQRTNGLQISFTEFLAQNQSPQKTEAQDSKPTREKRPKAKNAADLSEKIETDEAWGPEAVPTALDISKA